jgi:hypothetical protein
VVGVAERAVNEQALASWIDLQREAGQLSQWLSSSLELAWNEVLYKLWNQPNSVSGQDNLVSLQSRYMVLLHSI